MSLDYRLPAATGGEGGQWRRRRGNAVPPEHRTHYYATRGGMINGLRHELERTGRTIADIANDTGLEESDIRRLTDTGEGTARTVRAVFKTLGITLLTVPER